MTFQKVFLPHLRRKFMSKRSCSCICRWCVQYNLAEWYHVSVTVHTLSKMYYFSHTKYVYIFSKYHSKTNSAPKYQIFSPTAVFIIVANLIYKFVCSGPSFPLFQDSDDFQI